MSTNVMIFVRLCYLRRVIAWADCTFFPAGNNCLFSASTKLRRCGTLPAETVLPIRRTSQTDSDPKTTSLGLLGHTRLPLNLPHRRELLTVGDLVAHGDEHLADGAVAGRGDGDFHFHRFEHEQRVACLDRVAWVGDSS